MAQNIIPDVSRIVQSQRDFFTSGRTATADFRKKQLEKLYDTVKQHTDEIGQALSADLGKSAYESYATETGLALNEIRYLAHHFGSWSRPKRVHTDIFNFPARSTIYPEPYGVSLIMSPWNYPLQLTIAPLAAAVAAGNCAVVKPSRYAAATSGVIRNIIEETFPPEYICALEGGREVNTALLAEHFDFIFFTGSVTVGKTVMRAAADHLTPVCLELGGKSPCIVDSTADIPLSARRIIWGKLINAGQTCIAPDYVLADRTIVDSLVEELRKQITAQYGTDPLHNPDFPKIINRKHFDRLQALAPQAVADDVQNKISPCLLPMSADEAETAPVMQEEVFGPLLPVIPYETIGEAVSFIRKRPIPLALYLFSRSREQQQFIIRSLRYGGGCINDTVMHIASNTLPFGGMGESGLGSYHGKTGFDTFTHYKSVLIKGTADFPLRYAPFGSSPGILRTLEH
jgi:aldehyde dehydrogenase (NAD+)